MVVRYEICLLAGNQSKNGKHEQNLMEVAQKCVVPSSPKNFFP